MKILIVGKKNMLFWAENLYDAFKDKCNSKLFLFNSLPIKHELARILLKHFSKKSSNKVMTNAFLSTVTSFKPNIILYVSAGFIPVELFQLAKYNTNARLIGWIGDNISNDSIDKLRLLDRILVTDSGFINMLELNGFSDVKYLPLAHNPSIFFQQPDTNRNNEVVFIGAYSNQRAALLDKLTESITIIGKSWKKYKSNHHKIIPRNFDIKNVSKAYQNFGAVLSIKQETNVVSGLAMRAFEASACGALIIHDNIEDLDKNFSIGSEVLSYSSSEELDEIIKNFKKNPVEFRYIAESGLNRTIKSHKYLDRLAQIIEY